jgi:hypothetical protein
MTPNIQSKAKLEVWVIVGKRDEEEKRKQKERTQTYYTCV